MTTAVLPDLSAMPRMDTARMPCVADPAAWDVDRLEATDDGIRAAEHACKARCPFVDLCLSLPHHLRCPGTVMGGMVVTSRGEYQDVDRYLRQTRAQARARAVESELRAAQEAEKRAHATHHAAVRAEQIAEKKAQRRAARAARGDGPRAARRKYSDIPEDARSAHAAFTRWRKAGMHGPLPQYIDSGEKVYVALAQERRRRREGQKRQELAPCGTQVALQRHRARGEDCSTCTVASAERAAYLEAYWRVRRASCGTRAALQRHRRNGESCLECETAAERRAQPSTARHAPCGTYIASRRHRRNGETCAPCEEAREAREAAKGRSRRAACGTRHALERHQRRGETCLPCEVACAERLAYREKQWREARYTVVTDEATRKAHREYVRLQKLSLPIPSDIRAGQARYDQDRRLSLAAAERAKRRDRAEAA